MISEGLGRLFNVHYPADDDYVSLSDAAGVTFIVHEVDGATQITLTAATTAAGSVTNTADLDIDHYYGMSADVSDGVWHRTAVSPASNGFTKADGTEDVVAIYVAANALPDGYPYVKCTADGSGIVMAILHDLAYQRAPQNLRSITA